MTRPVIPMLAILLSAACSRDRPRQAPPTPPTTTPTVAPVSSEPPAENGSYSLHEWGLFGAVVQDPSQLAVAAGTRPADATEAPGRTMGVHGSASGGKPVIYAHLDDGSDEARFTVSIGIGAPNVLETIPSATRLQSQLSFGPVTARRGRCAAERAVPTAASPECATRDGYCEAAELGRYHGDDDVCLDVEGTQSSFLFYRAGGLDAAQLPLTLVREGDTRAVRSRGTGTLEGPVIYVERTPDGRVRYRALAGSERNGPVPSEGSIDDATAIRTAFLAHARRLGLRDSEADAFIDAWAPAFFDRCHRTGAEATGTVPAAFGDADASLLYFAPRTVVDALLPLTSAPPARRVVRAFLVRVVDTTHVGGSTPVEDTVGSAHAQPYVPQVLVDVTRATGASGIDADAARRVAERNLAQITHCYETKRSVGPDSPATLAIVLHVRPDGVVASAQVERSTLGDAEIERCAVVAGHRWAFPPTDGSVATITLSYRFRRPR